MAARSIDSNPDSSDRKTNIPLLDFIYVQMRKEKL